MKALIIAHDHVSPPGHIADQLRVRGYSVDSITVVTEENFATPNVTVEFPDVTEYDVVVTMGAPWSVYDHSSVGAWVGSELEFLRAADDAGVPVLGICFGGQMLAAAHGGQVIRSALPELGWAEVVSSNEDVVPSGAWFEWHYDRWVLPELATEVASNKAASQAFVLGRNLAVQFHPEATLPMLQGWLDNGGAADLVRHGISPTDMLAEMEKRQSAGEVRARRLVDNFLRL